MLSGKLSLLAMSFLLAVHGKHHNSLYSSSSSTSSSSGSSTTSGSSSGSSSRSSSSSDGYDYYTVSKKSSSSKSGSSSSGSSSSDEDVQVLTRCRAKQHVSLMIFEPLGKKLGRILDFLYDKKINGSIVVNGSDLLNSLNYKSKSNAKLVREAAKVGHDIVVVPDNLIPIKDMNEKQLLRAVQVSAIGVESATGAHPVMVHIPGGLPHDKRGKKMASLLKKNGYMVVHFSKTVDSHGKNLKSLKRRRSKKHSRRHRRRRNHSSTSSNSSTSATSSSSRRYREISSTTSSSSTSSSTSSSSSSRVCRRKRRHHRRAKGHIIYARHGSQIGRKIERTVHDLRKKGYTFVNLKTCSKKRSTRTINPEKYNHANIGPLVEKQQI